MYKIIVAGCGAMSDQWIETVMKRNDCKIVGFVDINSDRANAKKKKYNLDSDIYTNISDALEKKDANLVFDITTPESHFDTVTTALKAGCNVFGEKPMSDSLENAEKMVMCSDKTKKEYFVMQNRRYISKLYSLKKFLQSQTLGNIGNVSANFQLNPHFGGFREEMNNPLIVDMAIHTFDAARFITGKNPISVYCHEFNPSWSWYKGNASAICIFEMEDGCLFDYRGSWCANGLNTSWESEWRISCEKGAAFWDGADKLIYELTATSLNKTGTSVENEMVPSILDIPSMQLELESHAACITEMFDALESGIRPQTDCRDNINSIKMVYKAVESARERELIML